jgi:hypothetical protein
MECDTTYTKEEIDRKFNALSSHIQTHEEDLRDVWKNIDRYKTLCDTRHKSIHKEIDSLDAEINSWSLQINSIKNKITSLEKKDEPKLVSQYQYRPYWRGKSRYVLQSFGLLAGVFGFGLLVPSAFMGFCTIPLLAKISAVPLVAHMIAVPLAAKVTAMAMGGGAALFGLDKLNSRQYSMKHNSMPSTIKRWHEAAGIMGRSTGYTVGALTAALFLYTSRKSQVSLIV